MAGLPYNGADKEIWEMGQRARLLLKQLREVELTDTAKAHAIKKELFGSMGKVVHNVEPYTVVAGNPSRLIKHVKKNNVKKKNAN